MEFGLTPQQIQIQSDARQLAQDFLARAVEHDRDASIPIENYQALRQAGFPAIVLPREHGGWGAGLLGYAIAAEEIAQGCPSTALAFSMHICVLEGFFEKNSGVSHAAKQRLADLVLANGGKIICALGSEAGTTALLPSTYACSTQARRVSGGLLLRGKKAFCSMVEAADIICLFAHPEESPNLSEGIALFLPAQSSGLRIERVWDTLGMRATGSHNLIVEDCFVPEESVIDELRLPDVGEWLASHEAAWNIPVTASYLGLGAAALKAAIENVSQRRPKGYTQPIAYHPDIRRRIAIASAELDAGRWLLRRAAWMIDTEGQTTEALTTFLKAKYVIGEAVAGITRSALEMGGAHAIFKGSRIERLFRDGATSTMQQPTSDYCLYALGIHELGLDPAAIQPPLRRVSD